MRVLLVALCAATLALPACKKADPNSWEDQLEVLQKARNNKERKTAVEHLRKIGKKESVPGLNEAVKAQSGQVRADIAVVLGELKDASSIPALIEAIDLSVGEGTDRMTKEANTANEKIAWALGQIGDKAAVKPLAQLLKATKNDYVRLETINALGHLKDKESVPVLMQFATDERLEPFISKKAIMALGAVQDPASLPALMQMMFSERKGVSFYPESAFSIFLLGNAANDRVLALLEGKDAELMKWAEERKIVVPAIYAKAAQVESDLQDRRSIPLLMKMLDYEDENPAYKLFPRMAAADSLGRMRAKEAVAKLSGMLKEEEANARGAYVRALVQIGDEAALPKLLDCSKAGSWSAREVCMYGLAQLGGLKEAKAMETFGKEEGAKFDKECMEGLYGVFGETEADQKKECEKQKTFNMEKRTKTMTAYQQALEAGGACTDNACLEKALTHENSEVREHAAYALGHKNAAESLPALIAAIKRPVKDESDLKARFAAICAVDWVTSANADVMAKAKAEANALEALVEQDRSTALTQRIAEEVKRLAVKLQRG